MEPRKIDHQEIIDIILGATETTAEKLKTSAVIIPKVVAAALEFYKWLIENDRVEESDNTSRDVIKDLMLNEMKKRV